jgi:hypothetical protein
MQVRADDERKRILAGIRLEPYRDLCNAARAVSIPAVEDRALIQDNGVAQPMKRGHPHELAKVLPLEQRKDIGERVERDGLGILHRGRSFCGNSPQGD